MKSWIYAVLAAVALSPGATMFGAEDDLTAAMQKGLFEEEANHNLPAAIDAYQAVVGRFDQDRKLAATAVFRLGECYRKQGKTNEATAQYERVLREFSDQGQLTGLSRQYLATLGGGGSGPGTVNLTAAQQEQKRLLEQEVLLLEQTLEDQKKMVEVGRATAEDLRKTEREILAVKRNLAGIGTSQAGTAAAGGEVMTATESEEVKRIQRLIKDSPDLVDAKDANGQTPLVQAAEKGQLMVARFLLDSGADVNARDKTSNTALYVAARAGHKGMVELLLSRKAELDLGPPSGGPLFAAASRGYKSVVEVLLAHGADVNARNSSGETSLHLAAGADRRAVLEMFLGHGADVNARTSQGQTPLHYACRSGYDLVVAQLLKAGAAVNAVDSGKLTPLGQAVIARQLKTTEVLLANQADPNLPWEQTYEPVPGQKLACSMFPLYQAAKNSDDNLVELLLANKADPDTRSGPSKQTALFITIFSDRAPGALLKGKANPDIPDSSGTTPLHISLARPAFLTQLLAAGANVNAATDQGETPLHWAVAADLPDVIEMLIDHLADVNAKDKQGMTPLHWAVALSNQKIATLLLSRKADPNVADKGGGTALDLTRTSVSYYRMDRGPGLRVTAFRTPSTPPPGAPMALPGVGMPARSLRLPGQPAQDSSQKAMADLLKEAGALEDLPRKDEIISRRASANYSDTVFRRSTNYANRFSLLEAIAAEYGFIAESAEGGPRGSETMSVFARRTPQLAFPDLSRIKVRRPLMSGRLSWQEQTVDLLPLVNEGDCSKDMAVEWGDVVEIPEADHLLNASWEGFTYEQCEKMAKCLRRTVKVIVKGRTNDLVLSMDVKPQPQFASQGPVIVPNSPFWIAPVLRASNLLLASSDLTRVKVSRRLGNGPVQTWTVDCSGNGRTPDVWLNDGDVIEVPDR